MKNINKMLNDSLNKLKELQKEKDSISEFDKYMEEYSKKSARSDELSNPEFYNTIKAKWRIDYIDYNGTFLEVARHHITGENFTDLPSSRYESSVFTGTKKQLDEMLAVLSLKPHNEIKIIGSSFMEDIIQGAYGEDIDHEQVMREYEDYLKSKE
mgnify:FL=1|jgi:hypothetical protein|tara:strand:+ start:719 stop:1183 length:465 start_codon:yes stop_codon:yes gene_type:complete